MIYKDLIVWQKAHANGLATIKALDSLARSRSADIISGQVLRAVMSVGANIAEGYGRHGGREYERYLEIDYGSANEADNWFTVFHDAGLLEAAVAHELQTRNEEILRMLATMLRALREKRQRPNSNLKEPTELYATEATREVKE